MDYSKYQNMNFKQEFNCPFKKHEVNICWACRQFDYCINRKEFLTALGLQLEYTPPPWPLQEIKSSFELGRYSYNDSNRKQHLYYNNCGETYF